MPTETRGGEAGQLSDAAALAISKIADRTPDDVALVVKMALDGTPEGWERHQACRGSSVNFFPERGKSAKAARQVCKPCPVRNECLATVLARNEQFGVWARTTTKDRADIRRILTEEGLLGAIGEAKHLVWAEPGADVEPRRASKGGDATPLRPRVHQREAVDALVRELREQPAAQLQMAVATGKTLVGPMLAAELDARVTLVMMPSLQLIAQTAATWRSNYSRPAHFLAVCSDSGDVELTTTRDPDEIAAAHADARAAGVDLLVFATYQSSAVLVASGVQFDLAIADEAHHLAGAADKPFAALLRGEILAKRRVYMTATPRTRRVHAKVPGELVGMSDAAFGRRVYELGIERAIEERLIADYRIVVASVDVATFESVSQRIDARVDPHLLAGAIAVVRALRKFDARSVISFHSRVERASEFSSLVGQVADILPGDQRPSSPGFAAWLDGKTSLSIRDRLLQRLSEPVGWGVVSNAKALGEGVDLPSLDAVAIVDPKTSEVEVTQAIGRALRRPTRVDKTGLVVLPVLLRDGGDSDDPLASVDERSLEVVAGALRALRTHDAGLASAFDGARETLGRHVSGTSYREFAHNLASRLLLHHRIELDLPGGALGTLAGALAFQTVRDTTNEWEERFGQLLFWLEEHAGRFPYQSEVIDTPLGEIAIGAWVNSQRALFRRGLVPPERVEKLESITGWTWEPRSEAFERNFAALKSYVELTGIVTPKQPVIHDVVRVGQFVNTIRLQYKRHGTAMTPERVALFESLPGWTWNARADMWWDSFEVFCRYVQTHGHASPKGDEEFEGVRIGQWVSHQREAVLGKAGRLISDEQRELLRALPGWRDEILEPAWEESFAAVLAHCNQHGTIPRQSFVAADGVHLGAWVAKQRQFQRKLSDSRRERLETLPGWFWTERLTQPVPAPLAAPETRRGDEPMFETHFRELERYVALHGHAAPKSGEMVGTTDIGRWVVRQRGKASRGEISEDRIRRLEALPGWLGPRRSGRLLVPTPESDPRSYDVAQRGGKDA